MKRKLYILLLILGVFIISSCNKSEQEKNIQETTSTKIELEISQKQPKSEFDKYYGYFKDILGPLVALIGIFLTIPILRKKLIENHITDKLKEIQFANSEIQSFNQQLIDKYVPLTFSNNLLTKKNIENILVDLQKGFNLSQKSSSDVVTLMFYLKTTIQGVIKHYDPKNSKLFSTRDLLGFIIDNLELINFYSTQVVSIPKSSKTKKSNLITKPLRKYVTRSEIVQYKHFKLGIYDDPNTAHFTIFSGKVNRTNHALLMRSAFQIYWSPNAIAKVLYLNKIYAPSVLEMPHNDPLFGINKLTLFLIGFSTSNQLSRDPNAPTKVVDLIYSNPDEVHHFVSGLTYEKLKSNFKDKWIEKSGFEISKSISMSKVEVETIRLKYDKAVLEKLFNKNKREIRKKLKTVPNNVYKA